MQVDLSPEELDTILQLVSTAQTRGTEAMRLLVSLEDKLSALRLQESAEQQATHPNFSAPRIARSDNGVKE